MENDKLISFLTAKLAKERGFNVPTQYCYLEDNSMQFSSGDDEDFDEYDHNLWDNYSAPTQSLLSKWLRDTHYIVVTPTIDFVTWECNIIHPDWSDVLVLKNDDCGNWFSTYEEAFEAGIYEALNQIIK